MNNVQVSRWSGDFPSKTFSAGCGFWRDVFFKYPAPSADHPPIVPTSATALGNISAENSSPIELLISGKTLKFSRQSGSARPRGWRGRLTRYRS